MAKLYVLSWEYDDHSSGMIVRGYTDHSRAVADLELVKDDNLRQWKLTEVPLIGEDGRPG